MRGCTRRIEQWGRRFAWLGPCLLSLSCGGPQQYVTIDLTEILPPEALESSERPELAGRGLLEDYYLGVGDRIRVEFFYYSDQGRDLVVRPDGRVTLPGMGDIVAAGRTPDDLAREIETHFGNILLDPGATVSVLTLAAPKVYVVGMVNRPGPVEYTRTLSVATAISEAGGPTDAAKLGHVLLLRRISSKQLAATRLDLNGVFSGDDATADIYLEQYDVVYVPKRAVSSLKEFVVDLARVIQPWIVVYSNE